MKDLDNVPHLLPSSKTSLLQLQNSCAWICCVQPQKKAGAAVNHIASRIDVGDRGRWLSSCWCNVEHQRKTPVGSGCECTRQRRIHRRGSNQGKRGAETIHVCCAREHGSAV